MGFRVDLTGKRFGKLLVTGHTEDDDGKVRWDCKCDCGNTTSVPALSLRSGNTKSCGCSRRAHLEGRRFGKLVVKKYLGPRGNCGSLWECECDCGDFAQATSGQLLSGKRTKCRACAINEMAIDLTGRRYGKLTVVGREGYFNHPSSRVVAWRCRCDCGREVVTDKARLNSDDKRNSCGCEYLTIEKGKRIGRLVTKEWHQDKQGYIQWACDCDCGNTVEISQTKLWYGTTLSCGCVPNEFDPDISGTLMYILEAKGKFKIGISRSFHKRLKTLQTSCPVRLQVVKLFKNASKKKESIVHHLLRKLHAKGEWFEANDTLANIAECSPDIDTFIELIRKEFSGDDCVVNRC